MKTELFRQLLGRWVIIRTPDSDRYSTVKLEFFSNDERLIHAEYAGWAWFSWLSVKDTILVGVEEKGV